MLSACSVTPLDCSRTHPYFILITINKKNIHLLLETPFYYIIPLIICFTFDNLHDRSRARTCANHQIITHRNAQNPARESGSREFY